MPRRKLYSASTLGQFIPVVWLGVLGATLATKNGSVDPGALIVDNFGALAIPVLLLVVHGPIATNILNIYTFSVAAQALDVKVNRRTLSLFVGVFAMAAVLFFIFQADLGSVLDTWLIGIVAWIAAWGGIMLVHYYNFAQAPTRTPDGLFDPVGIGRLPDVNWATMASFAVGVVATWMFLYGPDPGTAGLRFTGPGWTRPVVAGRQPRWPAVALRSARAARHTAAATKMRPCASTPDALPRESSRGRRGAPIVSSRAILPGQTGYRAAASFTFDVDAESCVLAHDPSAAATDVADVPPVLRAARCGAQTPAAACTSGHSRHVLRARLHRRVPSRHRPRDRRRRPRSRPPRIPARADAGHRRSHRGALPRPRAGRTRAGGRCSPRRLPRPMVGD